MYGESSRKFRRTVYSTYDQWVEHRAKFGIVENLSSLLVSGVIRDVRDEAILVVAVTVFLVVWNGFIAANEGTHLPHLSLPPQPFTLSSPALGLLLVFRTNASYSRWSEARVKWATIHTHSINIIRMAATFTDPTLSGSKEALDRLSTALWVLPRCVMDRFSGEEDKTTFVEEMQASVKDEEFLVELLDSPNRPMTALLELSYALHALPVDEKPLLETDKSIILINECIASIDRIFTSPVPLFYTRHTARFLSLWMLLTPFSLYDLFVEKGSILTTKVFLESLVLVPAAGLLAVFLFGIQELSVQLEEPFSILPMKKFCDDIKTNVIQMQNRQRGRYRAYSLETENQDGLSSNVLNRGS